MGLFPRVSGPHCVVLSKDGSAGSHIGPDGVTIHFKTEFVTTAIRDMVKTVLDFRNTHAEVPFLPSIFFDGKRSKGDIAPTAFSKFRCFGEDVGDDNSSDNDTYVYCCIGCCCGFCKNVSAPVCSVRFAAVHNCKTLRDGSIVVRSLDGYSHLVMDSHCFVIKPCMQLPLSERFGESAISLSPEQQDADRRGQLSTEVAQMHSVFKFPPRYKRVLQTAQEFQLRQVQHHALLSLLRTSSVAQDKPAESVTPTSNGTLPTPANASASALQLVSGTRPSLHDTQHEFDEQVAAVGHLVDAHQCSYHMVALPRYAAPRDFGSADAPSLRDRQEIGLSCVHSGEGIVAATAWETDEHAEFDTPGATRTRFGFSYPEGQIVEVEKTQFATYFFLGPDSAADNSKPVVQVLVHADQSVCLITHDEFVFHFENTAPQNCDGSAPVKADDRTRFDDISLASTPIPVDKRQFGIPTNVFTIDTAPSHSGSSEARSGRLSRILLHARAMMKHNSGVLQQLKQQWKPLFSSETVPRGSPSSDLQRGQFMAGKSVVEIANARPSFSAEELIVKDIAPHGFVLICHDVLGADTNSHSRVCFLHCMHAVCAGDSKRFVMVECEACSRTEPSWNSTRLERKQRFSRIVAPHCRRACRETPTRSYFCQSTFFVLGIS